MSCWAYRNACHPMVAAIVAAALLGAGQTADAQVTAGPSRFGTPRAQPPTTPPSTSASGGVPSVDQLRGTSDLRGSGTAPSASSGSAAELLPPSADRTSPLAPAPSGGRLGGPADTGRSPLGPAYGAQDSLDAPAEESLPYERGSAGASPEPSPRGPREMSEAAQGWGLSGPSGRHYVFGNTAFADYRYRGERKIVMLELETNLPKEDENFLYYRDVRDGHRWAFATHASGGGTYTVYFQPQGQSKPTWQRFHRAELLQSGPDQQFVGWE